MIGGISHVVVVFAVRFVAQAQHACSLGRLGQENGLGRRGGEGRGEGGARANNSMHGKIVSCAAVMFFSAAIVAASSLFVLCTVQ